MSKQPWTLPQLENGNFLESSLWGLFQDFFVSRETYSPFLKYSIFTSWTIPSTAKVKASWWVIAHEVVYIYVFWIVIHLVMKISQPTYIVMGDIFRKYYA